MSWAELPAIVEAEAPPEVAARIKHSALQTLGRAQISIPANARQTVGNDDIQKALRADEAAHALGIHRTTLYRRLERSMQNERRRRPGGRFVR